ncbi:cytochrome P450 [Nocardia sp.]|uniref:cytochrome P450 n=1 Tax=Nocardia sp. TaxID=1821 RepID=UPI0025912885|nr:cytochrome P450 [Nocardia sp.]
MATTVPPPPTHRVTLSASAGGTVRQQSVPSGLDGPVFALHSRAFARDPHRFYAEMRRYHPDFARVELAPGVIATLVIGWGRGVQILHDSERFRADPSRWQATMDPRCPVLPMMGARTNALRSDGYDHRRYREATNAALKAVNLHELHTTVAKHGRTLIDAIAANGEMDLVADYASPLAFRTINEIMGCPPEIGAELAAGFAMMFEAVPNPQKVDAILDAALGALIDLKRAKPGSDVTTRLIQHAGDMSEQEIREQVLTMYAAGIEPFQHLVANTGWLVVTDPRFGGEVVSGACTTHDALNEVLFRDSPLANLCVRYPRHPVHYLDGVILPADQPVLISMAACNTDPRVTRPPDATGYIDYSRNVSHLSFSAGAHDCPARDIAYQCAADAIDELFDHLPDLRLACRPEQLVWRSGPFHRALKALPVAFKPLTARRARR